MISKAQITTITILSLVRRSGGLEGISPTRKSQCICVGGPVDSSNHDIVIELHWLLDIIILETFSESR